MKNRNVGYLISGIAVMMAIIVLLFNNVIKENIGLTCSHGPTCAMYTDLNIQTGIGLIVVGVVLIIGLFLIFSKENEKIIVKTKKVKDEVALAKNEEVEKNLKLLSKEEKELYKILSSEGSMFQADLVEKSQMGKVKVSRLLDSLESKNIIERKRRGMNNIVVVK
jgi:hypothetical protein